MNQKVQSLLGVTTIAFVFFLSLFFINSSQKLAIVPQQQLAQLSSSLSNGLIAHYTFDDTTNDSAGSYHGTAVGGPTYVNGKIGKAMQFDGMDDYVSVSDSNVFEPTNFTITTWIRTSSIINQNIVTKDSLTCGGYRNFLWLGLLAGNNLIPRISVGNNTSSKFQFVDDSVSNNVADGVWHFIASAYGSDGSIKTYKDGVLIDEDTSTVSGQVAVNNYALNIGGCGPGVKNFNGLIDDVRIYSRVLDSSEITELYSYTGGGIIVTPPTAVNGQCGVTLNLCTNGTLSDVADSTTEYLWSCIGLNSGNTSFCSLPKTVEPPVLPPPVIPTDGVFNVKKDGTGHFITIQECANAILPGGSCLVHAGTYNEYIKLGKSGTFDRPISFITNGTVIIKGFWIKNQSYINISGFEIVEGGGFDGGGSLLSAIHLVSANHINITNNYIHNIRANGCINLERGNPSDNIVIKNNRISWCINKTGTQGRGIHIYGNNNLVDGNDMSHTGTYVLVKGRRNVIRNNIWYENHILDFAAGDDHMDGVSYDCSPSFNKAETIKNVLIEGNFMHDSPDRDVKFLLFRDAGVSGCSPSDVVIRFNKVRKIGSYFALISDNVKNFRIYNNTIMDVGKGNTDSLPWSTINMTNSSSGGKIINNIFYDTTRPSGRIYSIDESSKLGFEGHNNLAYESVCGEGCRWLDPINSEIGVVLNKNPQFIDTINFAITAGSPAINKGGSLTTTSSSDPRNGMQLVVNDAGMFQDGWAGVQPDCIAVGSVTNVACISSINYLTNTIILNTSIARNINDPVYLYKDSSGKQVLFGSAPDIGAYEYTGTTPPPVTPPSDTTPPTVSSITTTGTTQTGTTVTWTTNETATSRVEYGLTTSYGSFSTLNSTPVTTHTRSITGLTANTIYNYRVISTDAAGNTTTSLNATFTTLSTPDTTLPTVSLTSPTNSTTVSGNVSVSATASDNVAIAGVQMKVDGVNLGTELTISPYSGTWNTSGVSNGTHTITATARDTGGNIRTSTPVTVTVNNVVIGPDTTPPTIPTNLRATTISSTQVNLTWNASTNTAGSNQTVSSLAGYRIYRNGTLLTTVTGTSYSNTDLTPSTSYTYTVSAYDSATPPNVSNQSLSVSATTQSPPVPPTPPVPGNGLPVSSLPPNTKQTTISLTTDKSATCKYSTVANTSYASKPNTFTITGNTTHSTLVTNLTDGSTYTYYVRCSTAGYSTTGDYIISFSVSTPPVVVTPPTTPPSEGGGGGAGSSQPPSQGTFTPTVSQPVPTLSIPPLTTCTPTYTTNTLEPLPIFTPPLVYGNRNINVTTLQTFLVSKGYLGREYITGYYGPLTQASINKYNTALNTRVPLTTCTTTPVTPITTTCTTLPTYALSLYRGITHPNVKTLQQYLNANGYTVSITGPGSAGNETSYYGPATANAVTRFKARNTCTTTTVPTTTTSTLNLSFGMTHPDIRTLQQYLNSKGYTVSLTGPGSIGNETNYFGPATLQALTRFQKASGIIGEEGIYGTRTRAKVGN
jgi:hypothetical protein